MTAAPEKPKSTPRRLRLRTLIKLALLVIVILILIQVLQILVPAIAYRDDLIALLNYSEDCKAPCFMGITPGETTVQEAVRILENHEWVTQVQVNAPAGEVGAIAWEWSGKQPDYLTSIDSNLDAGFYLSGNQVILAQIATRISFATVLLNMGTPDAMTVDICDARYIYSERKTVVDPIISGSLMYKLQKDFTVFYMGYPPGPGRSFALIPDDCS